MKVVLLIILVCTDLMNATINTADETLTDEDTGPKPTGNGNIRFDVIGDTSHLFLDEDFDKVQAKLLYNDRNESNSHDDKSESNSTVAANKTKSQIVCNRKPYTANIVQILNGSMLTVQLTESNANDCFVVMFYASWCKFSAQLAPFYNALPKAFSQLDILGLDLSKSVGYTTKFGTTAVPMIIIFQHKNVIAKFNHTKKNLTDLIDFVEKNTDIVGNHTVELTNEDFLGPIQSVPTEQFDYALLASWLFLIVFSINLFVQKFKLKSFLDKFYNRERHQHAD